jgi:hypothetical protein
MFAQWVIFLNLVLAGLRLSLKNRQVGSDFTCFIALSKTVFCFCARKIMA